MRHSSPLHLILAATLLPVTKQIKNRWISYIRVLTIIAILTTILTQANIIEARKQVVLLHDTELNVHIEDSIVRQKFNDGHGPFWIFAIPKDSAYIIFSIASNTLFPPDSYEPDDTLVYNHITITKGIINNHCWRKDFIRTYKPHPDILIYYYNVPIWKVCHYDSILDNIKIIHKQKPINRQFTY